MANRIPTIRTVGAAICSLWLLGVFSAAHADEPTTRPTGTIKGSITSPAEVPLSEMVVYLVPPDDQPQTTPPIAAPKDTPKISQKGAQFSPALLIICVGQTVEFDNDEGRLIEHNVFSNSPAKQFDLGLFKPGESRSVTFDKTGPVFLYCSMHRHMDGVIYVTPTPFAALVTPDGKYEIDNVPVGNWTVCTWQRRRRFQEAQVPITVTTDQTALVDLALLKK